MYKQLTTGATDTGEAKVTTTTGDEQGRSTPAGTIDLNSLTAKTTPVDADLTLIGDSVSSYSNKKLTWSNLKATLKTYFDTLYQNTGLALLKSANLSDLANVTTAKTNLSLNNVDNTSDSTKNSASVTLTNKSISGNSNTITNIVGGTYQYRASSLSPAASTTYYVGSLMTGPTTTEASHRIYIARTCTIRAFNFQVYKAVAGSAGSVTVIIRVNGTTDNTITSSMSWTTANGWDNYYSSGLSIALTAGNYVTIKIITPAWATTPTLCLINGYFDYTIN